MKTQLILIITLFTVCLSDAIFGLGHRVFTNSTQGRNALCAHSENPEQVEISLFRSYKNGIIPHTRHEFFVQIKVNDRPIDSIIWSSFSENSSEIDMYHKDTFQVPNLINEVSTITITIIEIGYRNGLIETYHPQTYWLDQTLERIVLLN